MMGVWLLAFTAWASPMPTVTMHDQWLTGRPLTLSIRYHNATDEPLAVPDLSNRPWLVKFDTIDPEGVRRTVHSTEPASDANRPLVLKSGETRISRFEIPTSQTWAPGVATIRVVIANNEALNRPVRFLADDAIAHRHSARPVDHTVGPAPTVLSVQRNGVTDVFVEHGDRLQYMTRVSEPVKASATVVRSERRSSQWITWATADHPLWALRNDPHSTEREARPVALPWPSARPCGTGATVASGALTIPVCIPSPTGPITKTVAAIVSPRGEASFRTIGSFAPIQILTNVDASGGAEFVILRTTGVDWAWLGDPTITERPAFIQRAWRGANATGIAFTTPAGSSSAAVAIETPNAALPVIVPSPR